MEGEETTKCSEELSGPSCLSIKSEASMLTRFDFDKEPLESILVHLEHSNTPSLPDQSSERDFSTKAQHEFILRDSERDQFDSSEVTVMDGINTLFTLMESRGVTIFKSELRRYKKILFPHVSQLSKNENHEEDGLTNDIKPDCSASEGVLKIAVHVLNDMGQKELAKTLEKCVYGELEVCQRKLRRKLKRFEYIYEGVAQHGNQTLLNKVYTELYITEGVSGSVNSEHEIRQIEAANRRQDTEDRPIKCEDIFKPLDGQERFIRTVLTKGIAGIGKTISVQKFNLEWAEKRIYQDIHLFINLPFRELNLMKRCFSLTQLLNHFLEETSGSGISDFGKYKLVLIFDGLDECRLPLDFDHNAPCLCVSEPLSVDVLLTNVLKGNLLPSAHIWITSRPGAASRIPAHFVDRLTEIRGFTNPQKEEYFRKKISNQDMASRVISHVKSSRSLHIMCHIPVFSWISATVLQRILEENKKEIPNTLTQMYTHYLLYSSLTKCQKYWAGLEESEGQFRRDEQMILQLGKLAFEHLMKSNIIFYESELKQYDIDINDAVVYSGMFTQISKTDFGFHHERVYCFVHLSIQEYFAALYVFHTFVCFSHNILEPQEPRISSKVTDLLKSAVDKALKSEDGHLDLFLRFLLGISQTCNQILLKSVLRAMGSNPPVNEPVIQHIKEQIRKNPSPERCTNLFFCLTELEDQSLVEEMQTCLSSGSLSQAVLSPSQWSALVFVLLTSKEKLDEFELRKYSRSEEGLLWLLPVMKESQVALLKECNLTEKCCKALAETLSSSCVKELDLSDNELQDEGVKLLSAGLAAPTCQLQTLRLVFCGITHIGCGYLTKALRSNPTHLKQLDLRYNYPGKLGIELLSSVQEGNENLTVLMDNNGECYLKSALKKYAQELTLDLKTAHSQLSFSDDNHKITRMKAPHPYPDGPERFTDWGQVLCQQGLQGRCYWEVEWTGEWIGVGVAYKGISRKAEGNECVLGYNEQSWSLRYCHGEYTARYNKSGVSISVPCNSNRVGVFLDWSAGTLSFYDMSPHAMTHLHTFHTEFSEPLYAGLRLGYVGSTLTLL